MVKFGKGIFHPIESASWPEFIIGSVIAGLLLGIGMAIGNNLVNRFAPSYLRAPPTHYDFEGQGVRYPTQTGNSVEAEVRGHSFG